MVVYADVVFYINLFMDTFMLVITSMLLKKNSKFLRLLLGGFVMALSYCLIVFVPSLRVFYGPLASFFMLSAGILTAYKIKNIRDFLKTFLVVNVVAFSLGGLCIALFYMTNISNLVGYMVDYTVNYFSIKLLLSSSCTFYILIKLFIYFYNKRILKQQSYYQVNIFISDECVTFTALLDTGNTLYEPLSNSPVILTELEQVECFFPTVVNSIFNSDGQINFDGVINLFEGEKAPRIRMIPFASVGKANGVLIGFKPDRVEILTNKSKVLVKNVVIGINNFAFSKDGTYHGLLNPSVLKGQI